MATRNGARALMDEHLYCGSLEAGKKADLIVVNPDSASMLPLHDPIANLVTAMHSSNVESTMCDGKWLMKKRVIKSLDERVILKRSKKTRRRDREARRHPSAGSFRHRGALTKRRTTAGAKHFLEVVCTRNRPS